MSTYDKFEYDRNLKATLDLMGINEKKVSLNPAYVQMARDTVNANAYLSNTLLARQYLKKDGQTLTLRIDSGFEPVTLSYCDRANSYIVNGPQRGRVDCITLECAIGTFIQDLARTVIVPE